MEMTRGEILDHLAKFAAENPEYRQALLSDPKTVVSKQFAIDIPENVSVRVVEDTADTVHIVLPHAVETGAELSDADLEAVAGGHTIVKNSQCRSGVLNTTIAMEATLF